LLQVEQSLTASLEEIRAAVVEPSPPLEPVAAEAMTQPPDRLQKGDLAIDLAQHNISLDGHNLELSPTEFDILVHLAQQAPNVVSAQELVSSVLGYACDRFEAADIVRHHIYHIRQKALASSGRSDIIRTVRGIGYALNS
jgi:two-component system response regulator MtrA